MAQSAFVKLIEGSKQQQISLSEIKEKLDRYIEITRNTTKQTRWEFQKFAFPYVLVEKTEANGQWIYLKGNDAKQDYKCILFGVGVENNQHFIQATLLDHSTEGDYAKATEFARLFAQWYKGEFHMFNKRVLYFNTRK